MGDVRFCFCVTIFVDARTLTTPSKRSDKEDLENTRKQANTESYTETVNVIKKTQPTQESTEIVDAAAYNPLLVKKKGDGLLKQLHQVISSRLA